MIMSNPELQRNLWLELSPRRLVAVPLILGLFFLPSLTVASDPLKSISETARFIYLFLTVFWGTRLAAGAVVTEIRERTWDNQRLSSLTAAEMLVGKLFGAPIVVWYGGLICLAPIALHSLFNNGPITMAIDVAYYLVIGLFAQSISLLTSLFFIRRQAITAWLDTFLFQVAGIIAGLSAAGVMSAARNVAQLDTTYWYGASYSTATFSLISLFIFVGWSLFGNWRQMRRELQFQNSAIGFAAFLAFILFYFAGFADVAENANIQLSLRLLICAFVASGLTYLMLILEAKDPVEIRRLLGQLASGRFDAFAGGLKSWMLSYLAAVCSVVAFLFVFDPFSGVEIANELEALPQFPDLDEIQSDIAPWRVLLIAFTLFLTRDVGIFLMFSFAPRALRPDFIAVVWLIILYVVIPSTLFGAGGYTLLPMFMAFPAEPTWLSILYPAVEAGLVFLIAGQRLFSVRK